MKFDYTRGSIFYCKLPEISNVQFHSVEKGFRPVVIVSSLIGILNSDIVMVCPLTTKHKNIGCNVNVGYGNSQVLCNQIMTVPKRSLVNKMGMVSEEEILRIDTAILVSLGIAPSVANKIQGSQDALANAQKDAKLLQQMLPEAKSIIAKLSDVIKRVEGAKIRVTSGGRIKRSDDEIKAFVKEWDDPYNNRKEVAEAFGFKSYSSAYSFRRSRLD